MKFDRNTVIGFVIMGLLLFGYIWYNSNEKAKVDKYNAEVAEEQRKKDSADAAKYSKLDTNKVRQTAAQRDSTADKQQAGNFQSKKGAAEQLVYLENDLYKIAFTSFGGQPKWVQLKNFKGQDSSLVKLAATDFDKIGYSVRTGADVNNRTSTTDLNFSQIDTTRNADGSTTISFTASSADSGSTSSITHRYTIKKDDYMIDFSVLMNGADKLLANGEMVMTWQYNAAQQESALTYEKENTQIGYVEDGSYDYHTIGRRSDKEWDEPVKWVGVRQRFFVSILTGKNRDFTKGNINWVVPGSDTNIVVQSTATLTMPVTADGKADFTLYYGPSDYHLLTKYNLKYGKLINLGQGWQSFVQPINKFIIMPIFNFLEGLVSNYGLAIALLTLIIRLLISPLTYSSYLSGAKMKALRPEIAALRAKHGNDQQAMSMEQMKLFREAGVNPLGGCIPALLQIPIFFALFSFFNAEIGLRGAEFLWANDLSAPDKFINFGTSIPLLGDHLSLFNVTAALTSFLISWYSMSMSPDQSNPVMKYLPYIFPVFLLFFFNRLPSALTWYYTVSNIVTLVLQYIIQNYIIDHNKILAKIAENRKKPKTKSKWQERMEQMQEQQKKMKEMQQKGKK